jgi:hypothetical protein
MLNRSLRKVSTGFKRTTSKESAAFGLPRLKTIIQNRKKQERNRGCLLGTEPNIDFLSITAIRWFHP